MPFPSSERTENNRFINPSWMLRPGTKPPGGHSWRSIREWQSGRIGRWPDRLPHHTPTGTPAADPAVGEISVTFLGHASFLLRIGREDGSALTLITDPIFSERCSPFSFAGPRRVVPPGRNLADLPRIDAVLVSHCHYDHMDRPSLRAIAQRDAPLAVTPSGNAPLLHGCGLNPVSEHDWWGASVLPCGTRITVTPARHGSARTPFDRNARLWGGFMIETPGSHGLRVFFAGDSGHGTHWRAIRERLGAPDLALIPIGAYAPRAIMKSVHMDADEAAEAILELEARRAIGMHYGTFRLTDEPIGEPPVRFVRAAKTLGLAPEICTIQGLGDTTIIPFAEAPVAEAQNRP